jgi:hypothetical protein
MAHPLYIHNFIFWDIMPCIPAKVKPGFGGKYRLKFQGRRISQARNHHKTGSKYSKDMEYP